PQAGTLLAGKVSNAIEQSNCVIAFLTQDGARSNWVNQEIGYAKRAGKIVIPVAEEGVPQTGFVQGVEYIPFNRENPIEAVNNIVIYLKKLKADKESQEIMIAGFLLLVGLLALASSRK
ncbi:MAG: toll/interleukin-1 receptor domain-containing protein, partial [Dehalococcoidales bacterium]